MGTQVAIISIDFLENNLAYVLSVFKKFIPVILVLEFYPKKMIINEEEDLYPILLTA